MTDIKPLTSNEVSKPFASENKFFDPDKRIDVSQIPDSKQASDYDVDKRVDRESVDSRETSEMRSETGIPDRFYSSWEQRKEMLPQNGEWTGDPGNSKFISYDAETNAELAKYGLDGIEYKNGVPDFSKCSVYTCRIENMTHKIQDNYSEFINEAVKKGDFNTQMEVDDFKRNNGLRFHECSDTHTCQLVPQKIHETFLHTGGRFECRIRDGVGEKGGFNFDK